MKDEELFELVRENYVKVNQDYINSQIRIAEENLKSQCNSNKTNN